MQVTLVATRNSRGGASRIVRQLANGLSRNAVNVTTLYLAEEKLSNPNIWPKLDDKIIIKASGVNRCLLALPWLLNQIRDINGPVICFGRTAAVSYLLTSIFCRNKNDIYVWEGKSLSDARRGAKGFIGKVILPLCVSVTYNKAKGLIGISDEEVSDFKRTLRLRDDSIVRKIYTPAITKQHADKIKEKVPSWYEDIAKDRVVISAAGSFIKQKNFAVLLDAFALIQGDTNKYILILMGNGSELEALKQLSRSLGLSESVYFPGYVDNPLPVIASSDCFVLSSNWEGLPGVLIEAVYCETRIVSTNCPSGPREILENGRYGMLAKVGDAKDIATKILDCLSRPKPDGLRERAGAFGEDVIVSKYLGLLK